MKVGAIFPQTECGTDVAAIGAFVREVEQMGFDHLFVADHVLGADPRRLVAKLAGGASMFSQLVTPGTIQMGERNVLAARSALRTAAIPIVGESIGGERGRSVRFHVKDGRVEIRSVGTSESVI